MSQEYAQHVLKVAVAQICRTIGWHSTHASTMDLLIDVTQHFLREISRIMHRYCELYNRTEANLDDLALAYKEIGINLDELMEYVQFVDPIPLTLEVPRFPLPKESNLNFLKPGSREVLTRPVHIPEYMPPLIFENDEDVTDRTANDEERRAALGDAKSLLNSAAIAIATVAATISSDARAITMDGGSGGIIAAKGPESNIEEVSSTAEAVDDGSNLPHAVINEEVEIPMQTIEVKDQPPVADGVDEESAAAGKRTVESIVKEKPTQLDDASPGGSKTPVRTEEGRPTREISSVIMTTSGFISPAREGKLPESRIPIIPEERLMQQPAHIVSAVPALAASHMQMALPPGMAVPGTPLLAGSAPVSSATLLASAAGNFFPKPNAVDGTVGVGLPPGTSGSIGIGLPSDPSQPASKAVGEKPAKKVKKKPVDREKKKAEKGIANAARKLEKQVVGEKGTTGKQPTALDGPFEQVVKEETDFTTPLPPDALSAGRVPDNLGLLSNPLIKSSAIKPEAHDAMKAMDGVPGFGLVAPNGAGKPTKAPKVKVVKEKAAKKRKTAAPKPVPVPGEMVMEDPALLNRQIPMPSFLPFPAPKPKKVKASKKAANNRGQFDSAELPPPLIGPLGLGTSVGNPSLVGPLGAGPMPNVKPDHLFGMMPNTGIGSPTTAALSLPLKKPPIGPFKPDEHDAQHAGSKNQLVDQAAQLNLLQKMHPSLEITASPSIGSQEVHEKPLTPGRMLFDGKGTKPDTTSDRDVIVIDDDKSPPHMSALPVTMATPPTTKKQRKQAAAAAAAAAGVSGMHGQSFGIGQVGSAYEGEFRPDDPIHFSPLSNVPKTPDIRVSSSTTPSWMNESPRLTTPKKTAGTGNLFSELSSKTLTECMAQNRTPEAAKPMPVPADGGGKKPKRPKQKPKADGKLGKLGEASKKLEEANQKFGNVPGQNPFAMYPGSMNPFAPDASVYSKFLNQSLQAVAGIRNPMPFGMFPLPSGPGLIPDNPLFPRMPPTYPGQHRPGFQLPPNPFVLPGINPMNLLRMPAIANRLPGMSGMGGSGGSQRDFLDEPLDPETKLAQTPLDLQKSTCNVAPLVPPSLFQSATESMTLSGGTNELLNLSVKSTASPGAGRDTVTTTQTISTKRESSSMTVSGVAGSSTISSQSIFGTATSVISTAKEGKSDNPVRESYKEDQVVILPAASFLPGASPPQRSSMLVVDVEDSDGSQSTAGGKSKDGKRKQKEHKKDRKLKDGKIKKKKDKKDKSKSKDRDREQLKELTAGTATSPGVMTMGMIGAEEALMEQLRKERKEKKEKRKEKMKKEKRKEKERMVAIGSGGSPGGIGAAACVGPSAGAGQPSGPETVPKLMLKIGGSTATQSPRSETPDKAYMEQLLLGATSVADPKRDGSPELARISALVTRPPKLKGAGGGTAVGGKGKKDDTGKNVPLGSPLLPAGADQQKLLQPAMDADETLGALKQSVKVNFATSTVGSGSTVGSALVNYATADDSSASVAGSSTSRGSKVMRLADNVPEPAVKSFAGGETSKKAAKESKGSKSVHHHHHAAADAYTTPVHMTDVDGNTVWICPACGRVDDGTPMIGCDGCDAWYHWVCVGIQVPPDDNEDWYCRVCIAKKQDTQADEKQRKRKKKDKKTAKE